MTAPELPSPEQTLKMYKLVVESFSQGRPMMMWAPTSGDVKFVDLAAFSPGLGVGETLVYVLQKLRQRHGSPAWVVVSGEAWTKDVTLDEARATKHGDLEMLVDEEGNPDVRECVSIVGISTTGGYMSLTEFQREQGHVSWGEMKVTRNQDDMMGDVADILLREVR